VMFQV